MAEKFYLMLYIQEKLRCNYGPPDIHPYVQSPSTEVGTSIIFILHMRNCAIAQC